MKTKCYFIGGSMDGKTKMLDNVYPCYRVAESRIAKISFYGAKARTISVKNNPIKIENYELRTINFCDLPNTIVTFNLYVLNTITPTEQFEMLLTRYCNT